MFRLVRLGNCEQRQLKLAARLLPASSASMSTATLGRVELLDGGTGEELFRRGLPDDRKIWSAAALVHPHHHALLTDVHASFLHAGADYITCNNYGVTPGVGFSEQDMVKYADLAGRLANAARDQVAAETNDTTNKQICGSLPPLLESYRADRVTEFNEGVHLYSVLGSALSPHVDMFLAETLASIAEAKMALIGVQDYQKPVMVSFTLNSQGCVRSGECVEEAINELLRFTTFHAPTVKLRAILFNCSQPEAITTALRDLHKSDETLTNLRTHGVRLGAYANRLTIIPDDWALAESSEPQAMRTDLEVSVYCRFMTQWVSELGVEIVGGCCGIGPEYIAAIHQQLLAQGRR